MFYAQQIASASSIDEVNLLIGAGYLDAVERELALAKKLQFDPSVQSASWVYANTKSPSTKKRALEIIETDVESKRLADGSNVLELYRLLPEKINPYARQLFLGPVDDVISREVGAAQTLEELVQIRRKCPHEFGAAYEALVLKFNRLIAERLGATTNPFDCLNILSATGNFGDRRNIWKKALQFEMSFADCHELYKKCNPGSEYVDIHIAVAEKLLACAETVEQLWVAFKLVIPKQGKELSRAYRMKVLAAIAKRSSDRTEIVGLIHQLPRTPEAEYVTLLQMIYSKLLQCGEVTDFLMIYQSPSASQEQKSEAFNMLVSFYTQKIEATDRVFVLWQLLHNIPAVAGMDQFRIKILDKIEAILEPKVVVAATSKECYELAAMSHPNSSVILMAKRKAERLERQGK